MTSCSQWRKLRLQVALADCARKSWPQISSIRHDRSEHLNGSSLIYKGGVFNFGDFPPGCLISALNRWDISYTLLLGDLLLSYL